MISESDIKEICPDHIYDDPEKTERENLNTSSGFLDSSKKNNALKEIHNKRANESTFSPHKKPD